jgi:polysaccharide biosynthesis/export protein
MPASLIAVLLAAILPLLASVQSAGAQDGSYLVQPGDRLEVSVLEDPGLNRTVLVRPDGRVSLPLAGTIAAQGLSPEAIAATVRRALARDFVEPPTVTVSLVSLGAPAAVGEVGTQAEIYVLGQVARPGVYQVLLPIDALQALALAGGPGTFAAERRIQIRRRGGDGEVLHLLDYRQIQDGAVPSPVIALSDGDVIVVPERGLFE